MAKRQFQLSEAEMNQVRQAEQQTRDVHELRRLQAVRLYGSGMDTATIMNTVNCAARTIRQWTQSYQQQGLKGLGSRWKGGNACKLSPQQRAALKERLQQSRPDQVIAPEMRVSGGVFWTVSDLRIVVQQWYGVTYRSADSYLNLLQECGFSYQRTERVYRSRPDDQTVSDFEAELEKK